MDGGARWATVYGVTKSQTGLSDFTFHFSKDYITTVYSASGQFLLLGNLLTNPDTLECILWEWVW